MLISKNHYGHLSVCMSENLRKSYNFVYLSQYFLSFFAVSVSYSIYWLQFCLTLHLRCLTNDINRYPINLKTGFDRISDHQISRHIYSYGVNARLNTVYPACRIPTYRLKGILKFILKFMFLLWTYSLYVPLMCIFHYEGQFAVQFLFLEDSAVDPSKKYVRIL